AVFLSAAARPTTTGHGGAHHHDTFTSGFASRGVKGRGRRGDTAASACPHRGAAGKLSGALWNHFVPGYNQAMQKLVDQWAAKTMTEVQLDFISFSGITLSEAEEAQA